MHTAHTRTTEAAGLTTRMANHFGHKCDVERLGNRTRIHTRFGVIELVPSDAELHVTADNAKVAEIAASHLERFARERFELTWDEN